MDDRDTKNGVTWPYDTIHISKIDGMKMVG